MGRKILIGCGALSVLAVLMVIFGFIVAALSGGGETTGQGDPGEGNSGEGESGETVEQAVAIGEPVEVGDVSWVVNNAQPTSELSAEFMDTLQGNFVVVDFSFTNNGSEAITLDPVSMTLVDDQARRSEPDTDKFGYIPTEMDIFLTQVNPGVTQQGQVVFTVAPDAGGFTLELGDAEMFSDELGSVELGF